MSKCVRYETTAALGVNDGGKDARRESGNAKFPLTADDLNSTCVVCMLTLPFLVSLLFFLFRLLFSFLGHLLRLRSIFQVCFRARTRAEAPPSATFCIPFRFFAPLQGASSNRATKHPSRFHQYARWVYRYCAPVRWSSGLRCRHRRRRRRLHACAAFEVLFFDFRLSGIKGVQARGIAPVSKEYG